MTTESIRGSFYLVTINSWYPIILVAIAIAIVI